MLFIVHDAYAAALSIGPVSHYEFIVRSITNVAAYIIMLLIEPGFRHTGYVSLEFV